MSSSKRWKRLERQIAELSGGLRLPNNGYGQPDVLTNSHAVEVKSRSLDSLPKWLLAACDQAKRNAQGTGREPLVILTGSIQGRKPRMLAVIDLEWLESTYEN